MHSSLCYDKTFFRSVYTRQHLSKIALVKSNFPWLWQAELRWIKSNLTIRTLFLETKSTNLYTGDYSCLTVHSICTHWSPFYITNTMTHYAQHKIGFPCLCVWEQGQEHARNECHLKLCQDRLFSTPNSISLFRLSTGHGPRTSQWQ